MDNRKRRYNIGLKGNTPKTRYPNLSEFIRSFQNHIQNDIPQDPLACKPKEGTVVELLNNADGQKYGINTVNLEKRSCSDNTITSTTTVEEASTVLHATSLELQKSPCFNPTFVFQATAARSEAIGSHESCSHQNIGLSKPTQIIIISFSPL